MKVKELKVGFGGIEIDATTEEGWIVRFPITGHEATDIASAIGVDHRCDDSGCDIHVALEDAGCPYSAAHLLSGATETPALWAVLTLYPDAANEIEGPGTPRDWEEWVKHHKEYGRECPSCNSYTYGSDYWSPEHCANCGAELPTRAECYWCAAIPALLDSSEDMVCNPCAAVRPEHGPYRPIGAILSA